MKKTRKVVVADLILGATYLTNKDEKFVYMGEHDKWSSNLNIKPVCMGKFHFFCKLKKYTDYEGKCIDIITVKTPILRFSNVESKSISSDFNDILEMLRKSPEFSPINEFRYVSYTINEFKRNSDKLSKGVLCYLNRKLVRIKKTDEKSNKEYVVINNDINDYDYGEIISQGSLEHILKFNDLTYENIYLMNGKLYINGNCLNKNVI